MKKRLKAILQKIVLFFSAFSSVKSVKKSVDYRYDEIQMATAIVNKKTITHSREDIGHPFKYFKASKILSDLSKCSAVSISWLLNSDDHSDNSSKEYK